MRGQRTQACNHHHLRSVPQWHNGVRASMRDTTFQSSAHGKRENIETQVDGRVVFDMLQYMRREHKLSSYSLNSVSAHFLGQQKEDVQCKLQVHKAKYVLLQERLDLFERELVLRAEPE